MANSSTLVALRPPSVRCIETIHRQVNGDIRGGERERLRDVREAPRDGAVAYIDAVPGRRSVVDYSLPRRGVLAAVFCGRTRPFEVCGPSPYLSRAPQYPGHASGASCPV